MFTSYVKSKDSQDSIIFGDGNQGKVKGLRKIAISSEHSISNVFLVESLGYNLLFVSQLCNMGYNCLFTNIDVSVFRRSDGSLAFKGVLDGKLYLYYYEECKGVGCHPVLPSPVLPHHSVTVPQQKNIPTVAQGSNRVSLEQTAYHPPSSQRDLC
jgi:hypothetical protein